MGGLSLTNFSAGPIVVACGVSNAGTKAIVPIATDDVGNVMVTAMIVAGPLPGTMIGVVHPGSTIPVTAWLLETANVLYGTATGPPITGKPIIATTPGVGLLVSENIIGTAAVLFGTHPVTGAANPLNVDTFGRLIVASSFATGVEQVFVKTVKLTNTGDILTPTAGSQFVLLGYIIEITGQATLGAAATLDLTFKDNVNPISLAHSVYVPNVAFTNSFGYNTGWIDLRGGGGYVSWAADNVLGLIFSAALTAGAVRVTIAYRELPV